MKKLITVALILCCITVMYAAEPEKNVKATKSHSSMISGKIIDGSTGEVLPGVCLKLKGMEQTIYSDLKGNFKIDGLESGTYDIEIKYVSYKDITLSSISASEKDLTIKVELESVAGKRK